MVAELIVRTDLFGDTGKSSLRVDLTYFLTRSQDRQRVLAAMFRELSQLIQQLPAEGDDDGEETDGEG